uniref:Uncharacterized protein n=1 Tax=Panagrolaimus sp. ES5 TaxID=591445 RepID=A0AC34FY79_9BILA
MIDVEQSFEKDPSCKPQSVAWEITATSTTNKQRAMHEQEEIWHVVSGRRRKNTLSSEESGENESRSEKENKKTNVYERLAYGLRRPVRPFSPEIIKDPDAIPGSGNLMCPRSAMDLPQTKASMVLTLIII